MERLCRKLLTWAQQVLTKCGCSTNSNANACGGVRLPLGAHPLLFKLALTLDIGLVHLVGVGVQGTDYTQHLQQELACELRSISCIWQRRCLLLRNLHEESLLPHAQAWVACCVYICPHMEPKTPKCRLVLFVSVRRACHW